MAQADIYLLLIDDEPSMLTAFQDALASLDYQISTAVTWAEAQQQLALQRYNLVISDIRLEGVDCQEMLRKVRNDQRYAFIVTTASYADIDTAIDSLHHGADDYLSKPFDARDLAVHVRKLVDKQRLQSVNRQLLDTIKVLAMALDARDHYTHGHSAQVTEYSIAIAQRMGLSFKEIDDLRDAGLLHDIGKIGISDAILLKPGRLTEAEYLKIKEHPAIGKKILEPVASLADKVPLIYHHHERFDGKGYPLGLKGTTIPLGARILAVADSYQAMTSDRPYRNALPLSVAIEELVKNKATQFDPQIVDVFVAYLTECAGDSPGAGG